MKIAGRVFPIWLIIAYVLALGSILAWPCAAFGSAFAFDAPGSANDPNTYTMVGIVLAYPILPILGVLGSYLSFRGDRRKLAYILAGVALIPFALIVLGIGWSYIVQWIYLIFPPKLTVTGG